MNKFQIPGKYIPGLKALESFTEEQLATLYDVIKSLPAGTGPINFKNILRDSFPIADIDSLASAIFSFGGLLAEDGVDLKELATDFVDSYCSNRKGFDGKEQESFREKIYTIFTLSTGLTTTFKIYGITGDNNNIFERCRILSDIRLLFETDLSKTQEKKGIIIHRLKISSREDSTPKTSFFSLDLTDLQKLKQQIERAIEKEALIKKEYISSVNFIETTD